MKAFAKAQSDAFELEKSKFEYQKESEKSRHEAEDKRQDERLKREQDREDMKLKYELMAKYGQIN